MAPIDILLVEDYKSEKLVTTGEPYRKKKLQKSIFAVKDGWEALFFLQKKGNYSRCITLHLVLLKELLKQTKLHKKLHDFSVYISKSGDDKVVNAEYFSE